MRQLFTWRFVAAVAALAGLALLINAVLVDDDQLTAVIQSEDVPRKIDLISPVLFTEQSADFRIDRDGLTHGFIDFVLDERRVMRVAPGTPGDIECAEIADLNKCAVFADLLGEAVIWFSVRPIAARATVELPPILDLQDGYAVIENGWLISYPAVIKRVCEGEDIVNFSDFLRRFGPTSTSVVDLETQQVTEVRCAGNDAPEPIPTTTEIVVDVPADAPVDAPADAPVDAPVDAPAEPPQDESV